MTENRVLVVDGSVAQGDEVYIAVCNTSDLSLVFSRMALEEPTPKKYDVKKMIVNMFDNKNIWLNEPGSSEVRTAEFDRIYIDRRLALRLAYEYQERERNRYIKLSDLSKEMVEALQKEIDNS